MKYWLILLVISLLLISHSANLFGQEKPPKPIALSLHSTSGIMFGAFAIPPGGLGGTVQVLYGGGRILTGGLIGVSLGYSVSPAIFKIVGNPGTAIAIQPEPTAGFPLTANGKSITVHINFQSDSSIGNSFILTSETTYFQIGGTLYIGDATVNPPGNYVGDIRVTIIQQ